MITICLLTQKSPALIPGELPLTNIPSRKQTNSEAQYQQSADRSDVKAREGFPALATAMPAELWTPTLPAICKTIFIYWIFLLKIFLIKTKDTLLALKLKIRAKTKPTEFILAAIKLLKQLHKKPCKIHLASNISRPEKARAAGVRACEILFNLLIGLKRF